jgi:hypothetical protein
MFSIVNNIGFQHKMDEVKAEPDSDNDTRPMFLSSEHQLLDVNDEGQIPFHVLQKGIKVSVYFYSTNFELSEKGVQVGMKLRPSLPTFGIM